MPAGHEGPAVVVAQHGALAAQRLGDQRQLAGRAGVQRGGVELHELDVGEGGAGEQGEGEPVAA